MLAVLLDRVAGVWEQDIGRVNSAAAIANVGDEHVGEGVKCSLIALLDPSSVAPGGRASGDGNGRAIHVHLAVPNLVEPCPGESRRTCGKTARNREAVRVWVDGVGTIAIISCDIAYRAAALNGVDDLEGTALGWVLVVCD